MKERRSQHKKLAVAFAVVASLAVAVPAASAGPWGQVQIWTSHSLSLNASARLPAGTWRLIYNAKNPHTDMHVRLDCPSGLAAQSYRVRPWPRTITFRSSGCTLRVLMLGYLTRKASGMFMRLELDRR